MRQHISCGVGLVRVNLLTLEHVAGGVGIEVLDHCLHTLELLSGWGEGCVVLKLDLTRRVPYRVATLHQLTQLGLKLLTATVEYQVSPPTVRHPVINSLKATEAVASLSVRRVPLDCVPSLRSAEHKAESFALFIQQE